ncbi:unnamed protein product [Candida verbasci]|uniref:Restriction of telomere capping protein 1 n=1 Tax=Candida verbasci TaxID=1227364 RepID=A0A9W4XJR6_9ASCO|nr:unnamed protein product [Candida verbasci]
MSLAKFAFNIYGSLGSPSETISTVSSSNSDRLIYYCDREVNTLSQFKNAAVIGGKNYLKLLYFTEDQSRIINEVTLDNKKLNINTLKTYDDIIAAGLTNGQINIYQNGQQQFMKLTDHIRSINSLDFIDENQLVSGSQDGLIKVWDLRSSKPTITLGNSHDPVRACQNKNSNLILSANDSGSLYKYDLRNVSTFEKKWNLHTGPCLSLHIHSELDLVATGGRDQKINVLNFENYTNLPDYTINTYGPILKVRWNNDDLACSYFDDLNITIYNLNRKFIPKRVLSLQKPISNFIWANNKIWVLTKSNAFVSYDYNETIQPIENLDNMAFSWNDSNDLILTSNDKDDYENPYIMCAELNLPQYDDEVFKILATNYLTEIPTGCSIIDVCMINSNIAMNVGYHRDCQVWRLLAISIEEESIEEIEEIEIETEVPNSIASSNFSSMSSSPKSTRQFRKKVVKLSKPSKFSINLNDDKVWKFKILLIKHLEYSILQGDVIFISTIILLFYGLVPDMLDEVQIIEILDKYVELLSKKQLFTISVSILNKIPESLKSKVAKNYFKNVHFNTYCDNCKTLIMNNDKQNYYCSECFKMSNKCVYCNEPNNGLSIVANLNCGHRGHFGCLKKWFVDEEQVDCPAC